MLDRCWCYGEGGQDVVRLGGRLDRLAELTEAMFSCLRTVQHSDRRLSLPLLWQFRATTAVSLEVLSNGQWSDKGAKVDAGEFLRLV